MKRIHCAKGLERRAVDDEEVFSWPRKHAVLIPLVRPGVILLCATVITALSGCSGCESKSVVWSYSVRAQNADTVLDMRAVSLVFQGHQCTGSSTGTVLAYHRKARYGKKGRGPLITQESDGFKGPAAPKSRFKDGYARISILNHEIRALDEGKSISVDGKVFSVTGPKKTITVPVTDQAYVSDYGKTEPEPPRPASRLERALAEVGRRRVVEPSVALRFGRRSVPELLGILADARKAVWWRNVCLLLGYIGDERAHEPLVGLITKRFAGKTVDRDAATSLLYVPEALGLLAQESDKALAFLEEGCSFRIWEERVIGESWLSRPTTVISLVEGCIKGVGISGRRDHAWVMELARNRKKELEHSWSGILEADRFLWWQETYGLRQFRREWHSERDNVRAEEYWLSERAAELKAIVTPEGTTLPKSLKGIQAD